MRALSKSFSQFRKITETFFSEILPKTIKFTALVVFVLWNSYKRVKSKYKYMSEINKKSSKFVFRIKFESVPELPCCSICLSEYAEGDECRELQCKHRFHRICLEKWLQESRPATCPICRLLVLPKETVEEYQREQRENVVGSSCEAEIALLLLLSATRCRNCNGF